MHLSGRTLRRDPRSPSAMDMDTDPAQAPPVRRPTRSASLTPEHATPAPTRGNQMPTRQPCLRQTARPCPAAELYPTATGRVRRVISRLVVAAAVLDCAERPTRLLCAARAYPPELAGRFELPGGKAEPAETPEEALVRELAEELSFQVVLGPEVEPTAPRLVAAPPPSLRSCSGDDAPAWRISDHLRMRVWLARLPDGAPPPQVGGDHRELRWESWDDVGALDWLDADRPIVEAVRAAAAHPPREVWARAQPTSLL